MSKILIDEATVKLVLEALEELTDTEQTYEALERGDAAITALREALAKLAEQPAPAAQEPLTDEEIYMHCPTWLSQEQCKTWVRQIEAAHNIAKGST